MGLYVFFSLIAAFYYPTRYAVIGDAQDRYHILRRAIRDMNRRKIPLAIHLGDYAGCSSNKKWRYVKKILDKFNGTWIHTIGNHEIMQCGGKTKRHLKRKWLRFWKLNSTNRYHRFHHYTFISFDTSYSPVQKQDVLWLDSVLSSSKQAIIFTHRPLPSPSKAMMHSRMYYHYSNKLLYRILMKHRYKIRIIYHGHRHTYHHYIYPSFGFPGGIPVICSGGGGGRLNKDTNTIARYHYLDIELFLEGPVTRVRYLDKEPTKTKQPNVFSKPLMFLRSILS